MRCVVRAGRLVQATMGALSQIGLIVPGWPVTWPANRSGLNAMEVIWSVMCGQRAMTEWTTPIEVDRRPQAI